MAKVSVGAGLLFVLLSLPVLVMEPSADDGGSLPTMEVVCDFPYWMCDVLVHPNGYEDGDMLILEVESTYLAYWHSIPVEDGWGVRMWFSPTACAGWFSRIELRGLEEERPTPTPGPRPTAESERLVINAGSVRPAWEFRPTEPFATKDLFASCGFIPLVVTAEVE